MAIFLLALLARLPGALLVPRAGVYNMDESEMVNTILGLPAGFAPTALQWPAGLTIFLLSGLSGLIFIFAGQAVPAALASLNPGALLAAYFSHAGNTAVDPVPLLVASRLLLALLAAATAPLVFVTSRRFLGLPGRLIASLLVILSPRLLAETAVIKGDALAMLFWFPATLLLAGACTGPTDNAKPGGGRCRDLIIAAGLAGLAVSCRFLYLLAAAPLFVAMLAWRDPREQRIPGGRLATAAAMTVAFLVPLLLFVPWIWTRPLGLAKSLLGNALFLSSVALGNEGRGVFWMAVNGLAGPVALILVPVGFGRIWRRCGPRASLVLGTSLLAFLAPVATSRHLELRYALPMLPLLVIWASAGFEWFVPGADFAGKRPSATLMRWLVTALLIAGVVLPTVRWWLNIRAQNPTVDVAEWLSDNAAAGMPVYLPTAFAGRVQPDLNSVERSLLQYETARFGGSPRADAILRKMGRSGGDLHPSVVEAVFGEDEAMDRFILACVRQAYRSGALSDGIAVRWYQGHPEKPDQIPTAAIPRALVGEGRAMVVWTTDNPPPTGTILRFTAGRWAVSEWGGAGHVE